VRSSKVLRRHFRLVGEPFIRRNPAAQPEFTTQPERPLPAPGRRRHDVSLMAAKSVCVIRIG
jgi:hypothetical protein